MLKLILLGAKKVDMDSGYLTGAWGHLLTSPSVSFRGKLTLVNAYKAYTSDLPLPGQREKFYNSALSITADPTWVKLVGMTHYTVLNRWLAVRDNREVIKHRVNLKRSLLIRPFSHQKNTPSGKGFTQFHAGVALTDFLANPLFMDWLPSESSLFSDLNVVWSIASAMEPLPVDMPVGKIQYIQEPGLKLRVIANPNYASQWFLEPLKEFLLQYISGLPSDCTFDQNKGIKRVQSHLRLKKTAYCFDMSDASNNLDRYITFRYITAITDRIKDENLRNDMIKLVELFMIICEGSWITPEGGLTTFSRGTPLGTGPSFPAMSITHHAILGFLGASQEDYVLLGDDIVIFEERIAEGYRSILQRLEIPISEDKSIISNSVAEFAGKIITSNSIYPNYKWQSIKDTNVLEVLRLNGTESIDWIPVKLRPFALVVASIPVYLGGLSWTIPKRHRFEGFDTMRELLISRARSNPSIWYQSKRSRYDTIMSQIPSITGHEWSYGRFQIENPYPNVPHYVVVDKDIDFPGKEHYFATSNPKALSSSSLIRITRGLVDMH